MSETLGYVPDQYERFHAIGPEENEKDITEKRSAVARRLKEAILATKDFNGRFRSKSELGAYIINNSLQAMQGRVGETDARWVNEVKNFYLKLTGGSEASWSGVLAEFSAARIIEKSGNTARFPGNIPAGIEKPRGYNEFTQAEQDRLQGIDWWLDQQLPDGNKKSFAVTVKSMPFTPEGAASNKIVYDISQGYETVLREIINIQGVETTQNSEPPLDRYNKTIDACEKIRTASDVYGTGALLMLIPSAGNDSNINRQTGEPSDEITGVFTNNLQTITGEQIANEPIDQSA